MSKLIILRGPSGAGKSTVAQMLHKTLGGTTALVDQDYYRLRMFPDPEIAREATRDMVVANIRAALDVGCDVIAEGILSMGSYRERFEELFKYHPAENYLFYFDVSFGETVRRHETRKKRKHFGADEMREWYDLATPTGHIYEYIIPERFTAKQTYEKILKIITKSKIDK